MEWVTETGSTNRDLLERAQAGEAEGVVRAAEHQTAGRGRRGRSWQDVPGASLMVSVLLRPALAPARIHTLTMAWAVAAAEACEAAAGVAPQLKWPNDLLVGERKLAGILAESVVVGGRIDAVVIGMGLNANWPGELPAELAGIATALNRECGREVDREELLIELLTRFEPLYAALGGEAGQADLLARYRRRSATLGRQVRIELDGGQLEGHALDVTPEGHLLVQVGDAVREVAAGDVVHLRPQG
ncbi:MAG: biotin--[acetyl-CoA-carboxylase] ligase [Acidimicrobiales bacterium]